MKRILSLIFFTLIALIAAAALLVSQIDLNQYKTVIEQKVEQTTGRKLSINGDITIAVSLIPTIRAEKITLSNPSWTSKTDMLRLNEVSVSIDVLELIQGNIVIGNVSLANGVINLETTSGKNNWDIATNTEKESSTNMSLQIETINLNDLQINYQGNALLAQALTIDISPDFKTINSNGDIVYQKTAINLDATVAQKNTKKSQYQLSLKAIANNIKLNAKANYQASTLKADITLSGTDLETLSQLFNTKLPAIGVYSATSSFTYQAEKLDFNKIKAKIFDGTLQGDVHLDFSKNPMLYKFNLQSNRLNAEKLLTTIGITEQISGGYLNTNTNIQAQGDTGEQFRKSLIGTSAFKLSDATYQISERSGVKGDLLSLLAGSKLSKTVPINCMTNIMNIDKGISQHGLSVLDTKGATVLGYGTVNFNTGALSLTINPKGKGVSLSQLAVPVYVKGTIKNPIYLPDPVNLTKNTVSTIFNIATLGVFKDKKDPCALTIDDLNKISLNISANDNNDSVLDKTKAAGNAVVDTTKKAGEKVIEGTGSFFKGVKDRLF